MSSNEPKYFTSYCKIMDLTPDFVAAQKWNDAIAQNCNMNLKQH